MSEPQQTGQGLQIPSILGVALPGRVVAVWVLMALNGVMFVVSHGVSFMLAGDPTCARFFATPYDCALFWLGWKDNILIFTEGEYWRLLTATFLHSGLMHLGANGISLLILGPDTERIYGTGRFVAIYLLAGVTGSVLSYTFSPNPSVGASGSIFGLFGALVIFLYLTRNVFGAFSQMQLQRIGVLMVISLLPGFLAGGVDNFGHIGGALGGALAGWLLMPRYTVEGTLFSRRVIRRDDPRGWIGFGVLVLILVLAAFLVVPPQFR